MATLQKAIRIGSSIAVVIPKKSLKSLGIKAGTSLALDIDEQKQRFIVSHPAPIVDSELLDWSDRFIKRYQSALEALARQ